MQVSTAVMQVSMRNPSCQCVMHVSSRNASFQAVMQSVPTGNASFPTEVFPASRLIKESTTTTTTSTTWCGEVDMTTIISNPCRPFRSEVGRSAARQPGSQAAASRLHACREAGRQASAVNADVAMLSGALLLEASSERATHCGMQPGEEARRCNAHRQVAIRRCACMFWCSVCMLVLACIYCRHPDPNDIPAGSNGADMPNASGSNYAPLA